MGNRKQQVTTTDPAKINVTDPAKINVTDVDKNDLLEFLDLDDSIVFPNKIHLRLQQRSAKKNITVVEGLEDGILQKVASDLRTKLGCSGTVKDGTVHFSGDQRQKIFGYLQDNKVASAKDIVIHGF